MRAASRQEGGGLKEIVKDIEDELALAREHEDAIL